MDEVDALATAGVEELETRGHLCGGSTATEENGEGGGAVRKSSFSEKTVTSK